MKRINIQRDVESRHKIASKESKNIVEPIKTEETDAKSEEVQRNETDQKTSDIAPITQKRGRKTKGNAQKV